MALALAFVFVALHAPALPAPSIDRAPPQEEEPAPSAVHDEIELPTRAEPAAVTRMMVAYEGAKKGESAEQLATVLRDMGPHDNPEFLSLALDELDYRESKRDVRDVQRQADELGLTRKKDLDNLLLERVDAVQAAAARILGNHPDDRRVPRALSAALADRRRRKERPASTAAVILSLGRLEHGRVELDVYRLYKSLPAPELASACVRYFGLVRTKNESIVRTLCEELSAPAPANVNSPTNPPAAFWEKRWKIWNATRRDVSWALLRITGQVFQPTEGEHPGDTQKALDYVKEHAKELGLR